MPAPGRSRRNSSVSDDDVFEDALSEAEEAHPETTTAPSTATTTGDITQPADKSVDSHEVKKPTLEAVPQKRMRIPSVEDAVDIAVTTGIATAVALSSPKNLQNASTDTKNQVFQIPPQSTVPKVDGRSHLDNQQDKVKKTQISSNNGDVKQAKTNGNVKTAPTITTTPKTTSNNVPSKSKTKSPRSTPSKTKSAIAAGIVATGIAADDAVKSKSPKSTPSKSKAAMVAKTINDSSKTTNTKESSIPKAKSPKSTPTKTKLANTKANPVTSDNSSSSKKSSAGSRSKAAKAADNSSSKTKRSQSTRRPLSVLFGGKATSTSKDDKQSKTSELAKKSSAQTAKPSNDTIKANNTTPSMNNKKKMQADDTDLAITAITVGTAATVDAALAESKPKLEKDAADIHPQIENHVAPAKSAQDTTIQHASRVENSNKHSIASSPENASVAGSQQAANVNDAQQEGETHNHLLNRRSSKIDTTILKPSELDTAIQRKSHLISDDNPDTLNQVNKLAATPQDEVKPTIASHQQENKVASQESKSTNNSSGMLCLSLLA